MYTYNTELYIQIHTMGMHADKWYSTPLDKTMTPSAIELVPCGVMLMPPRNKVSHFGSRCINEESDGAQPVMQYNTAHSRRHMQSQFYIG